MKNPAHPRVKAMPSNSLKSICCRLGFLQNPAPILPTSEDT